jgi:hypothetical protein
VKHLKSFSIYESEDLDTLMRDLRNVGLEKFDWSVRLKGGYLLDEEAEKDYVESWRSKSGSRVTSVTGDIDYVSSNYHNFNYHNLLIRLEVKLSDGNSFTGVIVTGPENYCNVRIILPSGYGPLEEITFSVSEGIEIYKGEKLIMEKILSLINEYKY